jgi:hypothetical protein
MTTDVKSLLFAYNDAINDASHDQVREFNINMARANLDDVSPKLAAEVIRLREVLHIIAGANGSEGPYGGWNPEDLLKALRDLAQNTLTAEVEL